MSMRRWQRAIAAATLTAALVVSTSGPAQAGTLVHWPTEHVNYQVVNWYTGKCADVFNFSQAAGGDVVQWNCWNGPNQQWRVIRVDGIWYEIRVAHSNQCLDVFSFMVHHGAKVVQWPCNGLPNQQWALSSAGGPWFLLYPRHAVDAGIGRCLDVANGATSDGAALVLADCPGNLVRQHWGFRTTP